MMRVKYAKEQFVSCQKIQRMKNSIGFQLFTRGLIILIFILSIAVAGRICILLLKKTSNKVFTEYIELDALQELKNELYSTIIQLDKFIFMVT